MTSPTDPPKESIRDRISQRLSTDSSGRYIDAEAQHTRNVTWLFIGLIVAVLVVAVLGVGYGYWESNLKPLASVAGSDVSRGDWEDRQNLQEFRSDRAETQVRAALAEGTIDGDLANRRLLTLENTRQAPSAVMEDLVNLLFTEELAAERGVSITEDEIAAAMAADGTSPEARRLGALVIASEGTQLGLPATPEGLAAARADAEAAIAALEGGASVADIVGDYAIPQIVDIEGDLGYVVRGDITEPAWEDAIFALEEGGITPIIEAANGELLIGVVTDIVPETPDSGFLTAVDEQVGEDPYRRNVELETLAAELEAQVIAESVEADFDQVELSEILLEGDTFIDPADDEGAVRASHILYQPEATDEEGVAVALADLAEDDPAWDEAKALADQATTDLQALIDADTRVEAFAERAGEDSDGPTGATGGDLGFFSRDDMVPEFADAIFDAEDPQQGDILGPVRSEFGWHVIMYNEYREPLADRVATVEAALAEPGADFATVAAEYSDGAEAAEGGQTGWHIVEDLDELTVLALAATDTGSFTEAVDGDRGFYIYQKIDEATRPLDPEDAADRAETVFADWYDVQYFDAEGEGRISIDDSVYEVEAAPQVNPVLPAGGHGG
jgi:parvulin-like peptidyl-prolyl isomerase